MFTETICFCHVNKMYTRLKINKLLLESNIQSRWVDLYEIYPNKINLRCQPNDKPIQIAFVVECILL